MHLNELLFICDEISHLLAYLLTTGNRTGLPTNTVQNKRHKTAEDSTKEQVKEREALIVTKI